jgi:hypothetical protein
MPHRGHGPDAGRPPRAASAKRGGGRDGDDVRHARLTGGLRTPLPTPGGCPVYGRRRCLDATIRNRIGTASDKASFSRDLSAYSMCRTPPMAWVDQRGTARRRSPIALIDLSIRIYPSTFGLKHRSHDHGETIRARFVKNLRVGCISHQSSAECDSPTTVRISWRAGCAPEVRESATGQRRQVT